MGKSAVKIRVEAERRIQASAPAVYRLIADYREHHPHFLPPAFSNFEVERGGLGGGTFIRFDLRLGGRKRSIRAQIVEPNPGRILEEEALKSDSVTTFEVVPEGEACRVYICTEWTPAGGVQGWIERRFAPKLLEQLYADELVNLEHYARRQEQTASNSS